MTRRRLIAALTGACLTRGADEKTAGRNAGLPTFADITSQSRIDFVNAASHTSQKYLIETMGGGVAMFDYDGDGRLDLFFVNGAALRDPMPGQAIPEKSDRRYWNRLFRNNGDGTFTDVTEKAGVRGHSYGMGVATGDYNNDGHQDLYVTNYGRNILYRNNGDGTFTDVTEKAGVAAGGWSAGACFVDYDRDGKLDLFVSRYLDWDIGKNRWCGDEARNFRSYCHPEVFKPATHILYHNNGDGTFTDVTRRAGLAELAGNGLGVAINDFDGDGWPDIVVANDARPQQLFRNNRDGTFTDIAVRTGLAYDEDGKAYSGMGVAFEDYNNDGHPDVLITNLAFQRYAIYNNLGSGDFDYVTQSTGVGDISMLHSGWGVQFIDYDNDGQKDIIVGQSHVMDNIEQTQPTLRYREPLLLMRNTGNRFEDASGQSGSPFKVPLAARGIAAGDLDGDGFLDVAINCNDGRAVVLRNQGNRNHWLTINTVGTVSNRDGIGARVHLITPAGRHQYALVTTSGSYLSASDKRIHFGLGGENRAASIEIQWPSGVTQKLENVEADRMIEVTEPKPK